MSVFVVLADGKATRHEVTEAEGGWREISRSGNSYFLSGPVCKTPEECGEMAVVRMEKFIREKVIVI